MVVFCCFVIFYCSNSLLSWLEIIAQQTVHSLLILAESLLLEFSRIECIAKTEPIAVANALNQTSYCEVKEQSL